MTLEAAGSREEAGRLSLRERLDAGLGAMKLELTQAVRDRLMDYLTLLERWNRAFNLVAPTDTASMVERHILDSLAPVHWLDAHVPEDARALDLGTGAGLPGLVLAIARPRLRWTLLDSNGKKTRFCRQAVAALALRQVQVEQGRAEHYRPSVGFDAVFSRAVADLPTLAALARPMLASGGWVVAMIGREPQAPGEPGQTLGLDRRTVALNVPGAVERHLAVMGPAP